MGGIQPTCDRAVRAAPVVTVVPRWILLTPRVRRYCGNSTLCPLVEGELGTPMAVTLSATPLADVTVSVAHGGDCSMRPTDIAISPRGDAAAPGCRPYTSAWNQECQRCASLVFTPGNWHEPQGELGAAFISLSSPHGDGSSTSAHEPHPTQLPSSMPSRIELTRRTLKATSSHSLSTPTIPPTAKIQIAFSWEQSTRAWPRRVHHLWTASQLVASTHRPQEVLQPS